MPSLEYHDHPPESSLILMRDPFSCLMTMSYVTGGLALAPHPRGKRSTVSFNGKYQKPRSDFVYR